MRRASLLAALTAALLLGLAALPAGASARPCPTPQKLSFARTTGSSVGVLRWRGPAGAARFRVLLGPRVVGQTPRHAVHVRVRLGRAYRFTVIPLGGGCRAERRIRVRYRPPGPPRHLTLRGGERGLRLSWRRARRGDGPLAGYRLLRDGAVVGQTRRTRWKLSAAANRRYRFRVVAVDTRGHVSRPSNAVRIAVGHAPPTVPKGVQAMAVSDTAIGVAWHPSKARSGRIAGYRVLRDGVVVKQVRGTSLVLGNLAASSDYRVSVVAVDTLGAKSAPSAEVSARTQDPVPTSGHAHAFLLASTDQSFADFRAHYRQIAVVYPTYYDCRSSDLALVGQDDPLVTRWAQARKVLVLPRINCQGTTKVHTILTDPALRQRWLDQLAALPAQHGFDGLSLDFEAGPASDRDALSTFVEQLAARLHAAGRRLTVAVSAKTRDNVTHPRSGIYDYPRLAQAADWVFVMAWGLHWSTSSPGPQDDATWATAVADYVASLPQPQRYVYGTNLYAMDWPDGGGADHEGTAYQYGEMMPLLASFGATGALDPSADNFHASYVDRAGATHNAWYPDATTSGRRIALANSRGFGGVGFWRLGLEDQRLWNDPRLAPGVPW
ncbi:MAG: fibronectin type III domain-containing protein [Actinobacteria bacterium]|nr:fibronectin type III domain-containing protein [Actinomycetota bacterium]